MPSCSKCGATLGATDRSCPHCGTSQSVTSQRQSNWTSTQQVVVPRTTTSGQRPLSAIILTALAAVGGIQSILMADKLNYVPGVSSLTSFATSTFGSLSGVLPYFLAVVGVVSFGAAFGYFKGTSWGYKVGLAASALNVVTIIAPNLIGLVVGVASVYFLIRTSAIKNWFHKY